jgi:hypothetical protein
MIENKRGFNGRGQVTIFIIVGIMIVMVAGIILFVNKDKVGGSGLNQIQIEPVRTFLRECVENIVKDDLNKMRRNAGNVYLGGNTLNCGGSEAWRVMAMKNGVNNPVNNLDAVLETSISNRVLNECKLQDEFDNLDIRDLGGISIDVSVGTESVDVVVDSGTRIERGGSRLNLGSIFISFEDDIYNVNEVAKFISSEYSDGLSWSYIYDKVHDPVNGAVLSDFPSNLVVGELNSKDVLGEGCNGNLGICPVVCSSNGLTGSDGGLCCSISNQFFEANDLEEVFRFGLKG